VSGVRWAYTDAKLINARPLVLARGFSDDSSRALAEELGVRVIELEEAVVLKHPHLLIPSLRSNPGDLPV